MNVRELSEKQKDELKESFVHEIFTDKNETPSWKDLADAGNIPDSLIFGHYKDICFTNGDFFCTADGQLSNMSVAGYAEEFGGSNKPDNVAEWYTSCRTRGEDSEEERTISELLKNVSSYACKEHDSDIIKTLLRDAVSEEDIKEIENYLFED